MAKKKDIEVNNTVSMGKMELERFVAIDFETADYGRDSACALSVVRVEYGKITEKWFGLIRPPRQQFIFSYLHGIEWEHVRFQPDFAGQWQECCHLLENIDFIAAHNASFDRSVLQTCCGQAGIGHPTVPYLCTMKLARKAWSIFPTKLSDVCREFNIELQHHDAASDAHACAQIVLRARSEGMHIPQYLQPYRPPKHKNFA